MTSWTPEMRRSFSVSEGKSPSSLPLPNTSSALSLSREGPGRTTIRSRLRLLAVTQLEQAIDKLESGKGIDAHSDEVHRLEDVGDSTSRRAIAELFSGEHELLEVIKLKDLYGLLEDALDRCETVANVLEGIATKNA